MKRYLEQGTYAESPVLEDSAWNNLLDVMDTAGELKSRVESDKVVDNSFAKSALQSSR
ncbi:hypothetical protein D3C78_1668240 [compost metagenome]